MMRLAVAIALAATTVAPWQAPTRDAPRTVPAGTGSISGVIESDDPPHRPLRRVKVMLNSPDLPMGRTIISSDEGTFVFDRLPAGRFTLAAMKDPYVLTAYGARRSGRPGTAIALADGESKRVALRLPRGGVITGTVVDGDGLPMAGVAVTAAFYVWTTSDATGSIRRLRTGGTAVTDDRGVYRIFGLTAADYLVSAQMRPLAPAPSGFVSVVTGAPVEIVSGAEIQRALANRPGTSPSTGPRSSAFPTGADASGRIVTFAPIFFPGVAAEARATPVTVGAGEERGGIDLQLQYVATTTIRVTVAPAESGRTAVALSVAGSPYSGGLLRGGQADAEGRFVFRGVPPGSYTLMARVMPDRPGPAMLVAFSDIAVNGEEAVDLVLTPQTPVTIAGRLVFDGVRPAMPIPAGLTLEIPATFTGFTPELMSVPSPKLRFDPGGRFTMDVVPGPYRFPSKAPGVRSPIGGWWLQSIAIGGRDILDGAFELRQATDDAVITLNDRATELSGRAAASNGRPAPDSTVVIFATDSAAWFVNSRRVAGIRTGADGRYTISNLPPGDYFVTATDDIDPGEWFDPAVLRRLAAGAIRVSLGEFQKRTQDLTVDRQ